MRLLSLMTIQLSIQQIRKENKNHNYTVSSLFYRRFTIEEEINE